MSIVTCASKCEYSVNSGLHGAVPDTSFIFMERIITNLEMRPNGLLTISPAALRPVDPIDVLHLPQSEKVISH